MTALPMAVHWGHARAGVIGAGSEVFAASLPLVSMVPVRFDA